MTALITSPQTFVTQAVVPVVLQHYNSLPEADRVVAAGEIRIIKYKLYSSESVPGGLFAYDYEYDFKAVNSSIIYVGDFTFMWVGSTGGAAQLATATNFICIGYELDPSLIVESGSGLNVVHIPQSTSFGTRQIDSVFSTVYNQNSADIYKPGIVVMNRQHTSLVNALSELPDNVWLNIPYSEAEGTGIDMGQMVKLRPTWYTVQETFKVVIDGANQPEGMAYPLFNEQVGGIIDGATTVDLELNIDTIKMSSTGNNIVLDIQFPNYSSPATCKLTVSSGTNTGQGAGVTLMSAASPGQVQPAVGIVTGVLVNQIPPDYYAEWTITLRFKRAFYGSDTYVQVQQFAPT